MLSRRHRRARGLFRTATGLAVAFALCCATSASGHAQGRSPRGLATVPAPVGPGGAEQPLYTASFALLVGVSKYDNPSWANLASVPRELDELALQLKQVGFDTVERLTNPTGEELRRGVEAFIGRHGYDPGHRLLFFFSGHGYTLDDGQRGYFVPRDATDPLSDSPAFRHVALSMQQVASWAQDLTAKHALFVFDSCFSGSIFRTRDAPRPVAITAAVAQPVRAFMSAGDANQPVPAQSVFVPAFIRALRGAADLDRDGFVTGTELGNFVQREVIEYQQGQTPQFGKLRDPRFDAGELVFAVPGAGDTTPAAARPPAPPRPNNNAPAPSTQSTAAQCSELLAKAGIGEPLTEEDRAFLRDRCGR